MNGKQSLAIAASRTCNPHSNTETFVALKLQIDNWRWAGVPFYLRTGKSLAMRATEIVIQFRRTPFVLFRNTTVKNIETNRLVIHIQPDEGISLSFGAKVPGSVMRLGLVNMDFDYETYFGTEHSTGYERLLRDCMAGDATLFQRADMVEAGWSVIQPVLDVWHALPAADFPNYAAGSWGPVEAEELLDRDGRSWRRIGEEDVDLRGQGNRRQEGRHHLMPATAKRESPHPAGFRCHHPPGRGRVCAKPPSKPSQKQAFSPLRWPAAPRQKRFIALLADDPAFAAKFPGTKCIFFSATNATSLPTATKAISAWPWNRSFPKAPSMPTKSLVSRANIADTEKAALEYEQALREYFKLQEGEFPASTCVLLGMGDEGHTLSLFPGTKALQANAVASWFAIGSASFTPNASP